MLDLQTPLTPHSMAGTSNSSVSSLGRSQGTGWMHLWVKGSDFGKMLTPYAGTEDPDTEEPEAESAARDIGDLLFRIAGEVSFRTTVSRRPEGWVAHIESEKDLPHFPDGTGVTLAAHNRSVETYPLTPEALVDIELRPRELSDVTPFLRLNARRTVRGELVEGSTVICSQLRGAPADRFDEIMARQIDTPEKFMRLLLLLIGLARRSAEALPGRRRNSNLDSQCRPGLPRAAGTCTGREP